MLEMGTKSVIEWTRYDDLLFNGRCVSLQFVSFLLYNRICFFGVEQNAHIQIRFYDRKPTICDFKSLQ
jgi:hypothetical protein